MTIEMNPITVWSVFAIMAIEDTTLRILTHAQLWPCVGLPEVFLP